MEKYDPEKIASYNAQVVYCLNNLLKAMRVPTRLKEVKEVTPGLVRALAQYCFDRPVEDPIAFLEQKLQIPLRHLNARAFSNGDLFNCLSITEIIYNLLRQRMDLPAFPVFSEEVVRFLRKRVDAMKAQAIWLAERGMQSPDGVLQAAALQDQYVAKQSTNSAKEEIEINVEALYQKHLKPLLQKYYVPYQNAREIEYTEHRLRTKLEDIVSEAISQRAIDSERFNAQLQQLIHQNLVRATTIERRNLVDEVHWRRDEKQRLMQQNKGLADAVMLRKKLDAELAKEREEEMRALAVELRREELQYVKKTRKQDEAAVFNRIKDDILKLHNRRPPPAVFEDQIRRQVDRRLKIYAGPERDVLEGNGQYTYRQRITGQWKNPEDDVLDPKTTNLNK